MRRVTSASRTGRGVGRGGCENFDLVEVQLVGPLSDHSRVYDVSKP